MENIENVKQFIRSLDASTDQLSEKLEPIMKKSLEETAAIASTDIKNIRIYNNYSYVLISVIFAYLKSLGVNTDQHPIMKELTRIKMYMKRLKDFETKLETKDTSKEDAEASRSFIQQTLGTKINGGGAAIGANMTSPAISSSNFQGTHKKFKDTEDDSDTESATKTKPTQRTSPKKPTSKTKKSGKITKPTSNSKKPRK